jgi:hypothetical protein
VPGKSDEYRERLDALAFRLWRRVLPLLKWTAREQLGRALAVTGLILAVAAAFAIGGLELPAMVVAVLTLLPAFGYGLDRRIKQVARRRAAGPDSKIHPRDFLCAPVKPDPGYRLSRPADASSAQLYPYVDLSHHDVFINMENELSRKERAAVYERWYHRCPDAFMHLEKIANGMWRPISISIMLPLSKEGYRTITALASGHGISVIDLDEHGILPRPPSKNPIVLIDTWIVDRPGGFGGTGHGKTDARGGNANLLVLRHLAQFWNSASKFRPMIFLVETENQRLIPTLVSMSFQQSGASKIGEAFYRTDRTQFDTLASAEFAQIKDTVHAIENLAVVNGTAPQPQGWYYPRLTD